MTYSAGFDRYFDNIWPLFYPGTERCNVVRGCPAPTQEQIRIWISCRLQMNFILSYLVTLFYFDFSPAAHPPTPDVSFYTI